MRSLFSRQKPTFNCPKFYIIIRFWWVQKMNRLTRGLSKRQLWFSLILFTILGISLCFYMALKGFLAFRHHRIQIDEVAFIRPAYIDYNTRSLLLNTPIKKDEKHSNLSRYIDSVLNISAVQDLRQKDYSKDKEIWNSPITRENKTANDKK